MKKREVKNWLCSSGLLLVRLSKSSIFCAAAHFRYVLGSVGVIVLLQIGSWFSLMPLLWLRQWLRISIKTSPHQRSRHVFLQLFHVHFEICELWCEQRMITEILIYSLDCFYLLMQFRFYVFLLPSKAIVRQSGKRAASCHCAFYLFLDKFYDFYGECASDVWSGKCHGKIRTDGWSNPWMKKVKLGRKDLCGISRGSRRWSFSEGLVMIWIGIWLKFLQFLALLECDLASYETT